MPGSIAGNPHQGIRSEYLAQYVFSAFGTAVPVPHPEDSGIDMYCTLGRPVGKRFVVNDYFMVQVKSKKEPIEFQGMEQVSWLMSHNYPLIYCFIDKSKGLVEIYQTARVSFLNTAGSIQSVTLAPDAYHSEFPVHPGNENPTLPLEAPILSFEIERLSDVDWVSKARAVLAGWVRLDQENISLRSAGCTIYRYPATYTTNLPPAAPWNLAGSFRKFAADDPRTLKFHDALFRLLSQQINQAVADSNVARFKAIELFARTMTDSKLISHCWGVKLFAFCYNKGLEKLGLPGGLSWG